MKKRSKIIGVMLGILLVCLSFLICGILINKDKAFSSDVYAITDGGSIYIKSGATYTMNGGSIKNKTAVNGGFIYVASGATFIMNGGTLSGGTASYGGAIYVAEGGKCYLNSGTITNSTSTVAGNAVYIEDGGYLEMGEGFVISGSGADYSESIKPVNPANVKRPITVTPYVNGVVKTAISTYSNVALNSIGLPNQTGCGWYEEVDYNNKVSTSDLVGNYAETNKLNLYFPSHTYGSWETTVVATCTATGLQNKTCTICNDVQSQIIQKDGTNHGTWGTYNSTIKYATCLNTGTMGTYCKGCNVLKGSSTIAINSDNHEKTTTHNSTITAATCTATGTLGTYYDCCNALKTSSVIQALGHTYGSWTTTTTATCYRAEVQTRTCSRDSSHKETKTLSVADHIYNDYISTTAPTCVAEGYDKYECQWCTKYVYTNYKSALGHDYEEWKTTKIATCKATGTKQRDCSRCTSYETQTIAKDSTNHDSWGSWVTTTTPTCRVQEVQTATCSGCNATKTQTLSTVNHIYDDFKRTIVPTCKAQGYDYYECRWCTNYTYKNYTAKDSTNHDSWGGWVTTTTPTCQVKEVQTATCSGCSATKTQTLSTVNHIYDDFIRTIAPTCKAQGYDYYECRWCNDYTYKNYTAKDSTNHDSWGSWVTTTSPTCQVKEVQTKTCSGCSATKTQTLSKADHIYDDFIRTIAPTCKAQGYDYYECRWCTDYTYKNYTAKDSTNHDSWGSWVTTTTPTCKKAEVQTATCSGCSATKTQTLSTVDHIYNDYISTTAPTCTEQGYDKYECQWCYDYVYKNYTAIDSTNHNWGNWVTTTTPTCKRAEVQTRTCTRSSSHTETQTLSTVDHVYNDYISTTEPTCTAQGYDKYECNWCYDYVYKNYTGPTGHSSSATYGNAKYCTTSGFIKYVCDNCGATTSTSQYSSHSLSTLVISDSTCITAGRTQSACTRSGCEYSTTSTQAIDPSNHASTGTYTSTQAATCTAAGMKYVYHSCCDQLKSSTKILPLGHNYSQTATRHTCKRCSTSGVHIFQVGVGNGSLCVECGYQSNVSLNFAPTTNNSVCDDVDCETNKHYPKETVFIKKETAFIKEEDNFFSIK